jgi:hypothetical protein
MLTINTPSTGDIVYTDLTPLWTVAQLKDRLAAEVNIPSGKQKLVTSTGVVLKNALTLYQSVIKSGETLTLTFKDRGGKKK